MATALQRAAIQYRIEKAAENDALRRQQRAAARVGATAETAANLLAGAETAVRAVPSEIVGQIERGTGLNIGLGERMKRPMIAEIPEIPISPKASPLVSIPAGFGNAAITIANFLQTPDALMALFQRRLPARASQAVRQAWASDLVNNAPERAQRTMDAIQKGDTGTAAREAALGLAELTGAAGLAGSTLPKVTMPRVPTFDEASQLAASRKALAASMPSRVFSPVVVPTTERQLMARPEAIEPPSGMEFTPGPFRRVLPFEMEWRDPAEMVSEDRPFVERETRGKISFGAPAEAGAIPSSRQQAIELPAIESERQAALAAIAKATTEEGRNAVRNAFRARTGEELE